MSAKVEQPAQTNNPVTASLLVTPSKDPRFESLDQMKKLEVLSEEGAVFKYTLRLQRIFISNPSMPAMDALNAIHQEMMEEIKSEYFKS